MHMFKSHMMRMLDQISAQGPYAILSPNKDNTEWIARAVGFEGRGKSPEDAVSALHKRIFGTTVREF